MPEYIYNYFNVRGRGELARLVFAAAGVDYNDNRIPNEAWEENDCVNDIVKAAPCGTLPYLEVDGVKINGSTVIARFVANEFHLAGKNNLEAAQCDAFIETVFDAFHSWLKHVQVIRDPSEKEAANAKYYAEKLPVHYENLEKLIRLYGKDGFCVGNSLTLADLCLHAYTDSHYRRDPSLKQAFPLVNRVIELVEADPKVAAYLKKRPFTNY